MKFFTVESLGPKRHLTPEGFLVCEDVVLARTGSQTYHRRDIIPPPTEDDSTVIDVARSPEEVFHPLAIASANGKPMANDHPPDGQFIELHNYGDYAVGHILNPHRGTGDDEDVLLGDLLFTDKPTIEDIKDDEKREISLGYSFDFESISPGKGKQVNIRINHGALVNKGRCGPRCRIGDHAETPCNCKDCTDMAKANDRRSMMDRLRTVFKTGDEKEQEKAVEDLLNKEKGEDSLETGGSESGTTHVHVHMGAGGKGAESEDDDDAPAPAGGEGEPPTWFKTHVEQNNAQFAAIKAVLAKLAPEEDEGEEEAMDELEKEAPKDVPAEKARKAGDSTLLADAYQETVAMAEVIAPGIGIPTFDRAAKPRKTLDSIVGLRRQALELAYVQPKTRTFIDDALGGRTLEARKMSFDSLRTTFRAVGAAVKRVNNSGDTQRVRAADSGNGYDDVARPLSSPADINAMLKKRRDARFNQSQH